MAPLAPPYVQLSSQYSNTQVKLNFTEIPLIGPRITKIGFLAKLLLLESKTAGIGREKFEFCPRIFSAA